MRGLMSPSANFCVTVQIVLLFAVTWETVQGTAERLESSQQLYDEESNHVGVWNGESSGYYDDVRRTNASHEWVMTSILFLALLVTQVCRKQSGSRNLKL